MALTTCRECGGQVSTEATSCPHCGCPAPVPTPAPAPKAAPTPASPKKYDIDFSNSAWGCLGLVALILVVVVASYLLRTPSEEKPAPPDEPDKIAAWTMTQQFVKERLKAPGTASFGSVFGDYQDPDKCVTDLGGWRFAVVGWVDAENAFGAKLRSNFKVTLRYTGNDKWQLEKIDISPP